MGVKIDDKDIADVKIGDSQISSIYAGEVLVWSAIKNIFAWTSTKAGKLRVNGTIIDLEDTQGSITLPRLITGFDLFVSNVFTKADLSQFSNAHLTTIDRLFSDCKQLSTIIGLDKLDVSNATSARYAFNGVPATDAEGLETWNVSSINNTMEMFKECKISYDRIKNLDFSSVVDATRMFYAYTPNLFEFDCSIFRNNINDIATSSMFFRAEIAKFYNSTNNTVNFKNIDSLFFGNKLTEADFTNINIVPSTLSIERTFSDCSSLTTIKGLDFSNKAITNANYFLNGANKINSYNNGGRLTFNFSNASCASMFFSCSSLTNPITLKGSISNAQSMFNSCSGLTDIDLSNVDFSNCTNTSGMFRGCRFLSSIQGLDSMNLQAVTDMSSMFNGCYVIVNLPNFKATKVRQLDYAFGGSSSDVTQKIEVANFSQWGNLTSLQSLDNTFVYCRALREVHFSGEVANITNLQATFVGCTNLEVVDGIENWNTENCQNLTPFAACKVKNLNISGWSTKSDWFNANLLPDSLETLVVGTGIFDKNSTTLKYLEALSKWTDVTTIGIMLNALISHPKTVDEDWQYTQTVSLSKETWNTIQNSETLSALFDEACDAGWEISHV